MTKTRTSGRMPYLIYSGIALAVLLPLLLPGYVLTLDMVFTPDLPMPEHLTSSYLFRVLLHVLNFAVPSQVIEKILLFLILFLSGIGMHALVRYLQDEHGDDGSFKTEACYIAGAFYMVNPYTYARFMAGQYSVLLGYALLPFFVRSFLRFLHKPDRRTAVVTAVWATIIGIVSIHTLGLLALLIIIGLLLNVSRWRTIGRYGWIGVLIFVLASSYWLLPLIFGQGETVRQIGRFGTGDFQAFATIGDGVIGQIGNILRLQGFWVEGRGLFALPQNQLTGWWLVVLAVLVLAVLGGRAWWKADRESEVILLGLAALGAVMLNIGGLHAWLGSHLPLFGGFREPHKFVGLLALMYALFAGQGAMWLVRHWQKRFSEVTAQIALACVVLVWIAWTSNMFWGFGGQLRPRQYPADWFATNRELNQDQDDFQVLFLPWHLYMHFGFAGRIIANPAKDFFDKPIIVSDNPELGDASPTTADNSRHLLQDEILQQASRRDDLGARIARHGIKYVLLAKDADAHEYRYLDSQKDLQLVRESATLKVYRNTRWEH